MFRLMISGIILVVALVMFAGCGEYIPPREIPDLDAPWVVGVSPRHNSTNVLPNVSVIVSFSESIDKSTLDQYSLCIYNSSGVMVPSNIYYQEDRKSAAIEPENVLDGGKEYTVIIYNSIMDLSGNRLGNDQESKFKVRSYQLVEQGPYVLKAYPEVQGQYVQPDEDGLYQFWVEFSGQLDESTVTKDGIFLLDLRYYSIIPSVLLYDPLNFRITVRPADGAIYENQYLRLFVNKRITGDNGVSIQSVYYLDFNTVRPTIPALTDIQIGDLNGVELVVCGEYNSLDSADIKRLKRSEVSILARFNQDMDLSTFIPENFGVVFNSTYLPVAGSVQIFPSNHKVARFLFEEELMYNTIYRVFVRESIKSSFGINLTPPYNTAVMTIDYDSSWMPTWNSSVYNASELEAEDTGCAPPDR